MMSLASESVMRGSGLSVPAELVPLLGPGTGIRPPSFRPRPGVVAGRSRLVRLASRRCRRAGRTPAPGAGPEKPPLWNYGWRQRDVAELRHLERAVDDRSASPRGSSHPRSTCARTTEDRRTGRCRRRRLLGHRPRRAGRSRFAQRGAQLTVLPAPSSSSRARLAVWIVMNGRIAAELRCRSPGRRGAMGSSTAPGGALLNRVDRVAAAALSSPRSNGLSSEIRVASHRA